jgi:hypothetical protein
VKCLIRYSLSGREIEPVKPLLVTTFYLYRNVEASSEVLELRELVRDPDQGGRHGLVGSLAGAVHLLNSNAGVLR